MTRILPSVLALLSVFPLFAQDDLLNFSITGSSNTESPAENATYAMVHHEVQRLLLDIAQSPRTEDYVEKSLGTSGVSLQDMISNGSIRLENGRYWLNFSLLTRSDQEIVREATETYSQRLADAMLKRRASIESLLNGYKVGEVDPKEVAFIVLGCFSLDWDGLDLSTAHGYRAAPPKRKGGEFFFMAEETGGLSLQRIYWGSGSGQYGRYGFASFGDHFSPRPSAIYTVQKSGSAKLRQMSEEDLAQKIGAIMFALRRGPQGAPALAAAIGQDTPTTKQILDGLSSISWIGPQDNRFHARIPVLTAADQKMVSGLRKIGSEVILSWLAENYAPFQSSVKEITPVRNRVPYQQTFDQLWHYLFGIANQKLVEAGLFADPYASGAPHPGYVPVVFDVHLTAQ